ncbi:MAG TPA: AcvB/VirJ family lysyl-phosphatidylglycerol hydrolase [Terriglobales bacterium]|nr:AcvB/VirJ family lysyl-phosphatidylglycerol hydrolase [Terriglobales bacterium]
MNRARLWIAVLILLMATAGFASGPAVGKNEVWVRGQEQYVYWVPAKGAKRLGPVLYLPGDGGWHGLAIKMADTMASWGYDVYGVDTRRYLMSLGGNSPLADKDIAGDLRQLMEFSNGGSHAKFAVTGWSEGAGLCLVLAASPESQAKVRGVIGIGVPEKNIRALKWSDLLAQIRKVTPDEPVFESADYVGRISPIPLAMIQSTGDEYASVETSQRIFLKARDPKKFTLIDADNHHFDRNQDQLFEKIREALQWIDEQSH